MNNILSSVKLDFYILKSLSVRILSAVGLIAVIVGFIAKNPQIISGLILMVSSFMVGAIFAAVEKNNLKQLYGTLPVGRVETVVGRYVFAALACLMAAVLGIILTFVVATLTHVKLDSLVVTAWLSGAILLFCLLVAIQFPLYFKFDYSKISGFVTFPFVILVVLASTWGKKNPRAILKTVSYFVNNHYMIWVAAIGGGLILLALSMFVSIGFYKTKEL